jgi:molybdopterin-guanine dinucleotide biosynthesis protein A
LKILDFFSAVKVSHIVDTALRPMDQEGMSFFNINTPADLESARQYLPLSVLEQENEQSSFG